MATALVNSSSTAPATIINNNTTNGKYITTFVLKANKFKDAASSSNSYKPKARGQMSTSNSIASKNVIYNSISTPESTTSSNAAYSTHKVAIQVTSARPKVSPSTITQSTKTSYMTPTKTAGTRHPQQQEKTRDNRVNAMLINSTTTQLKNESSKQHNKLNGTDGVTKIQDEQTKDRNRRASQKKTRTEQQQTNQSKVVIPRDVLTKLEQERTEAERILMEQKQESSKQTTTLNSSCQSMKKTTTVKAAETSSTSKTTGAPLPPPPPTVATAATTATMKTKPAIPAATPPPTTIAPASYKKQIVYEWDQYGNQIIQEKVSKVISSDSSNNKPPVRQKETIKDQPPPSPVVVTVHHKESAKKQLHSSSSVSTVTIATETTTIVSENTEPESRPSSLLLNTSHNFINIDKNTNINNNNSNNNDNNNNNNNNYQNNISTDNIDSTDCKNVRLNSKGNRPPPVIPKSKIERQSSQNYNKLQVSPVAESLYATVLKKKDRSPSPPKSPVLNGSTAQSAGLDILHGSAAQSTNPDDSVLPPTPQMSPVEIPNEPVYTLPPFLLVPESPSPAPPKTLKPSPPKKEPIYDSVSEETKQMILNQKKTQTNQPDVTLDATTLVDNKENLYSSADEIRGEKQTPVYVSHADYDYIDQSITLGAEERPSPLDSPDVFSGLNTEFDKQSIRSDDTTVFPYGPKPGEHHHKKNGLQSAITSFIHRKKSKKNYNVKRDEDKLLHQQQREFKQQKSPQLYRPIAQGGTSSSDYNRLPIEKENVIVTSGEQQLHNHSIINGDTTATSEQQLTNNYTTIARDNNNTHLKPRMVAVKVEDANPGANQQYHSFPMKVSHGFEPHYSSITNVSKQQHYGDKSNFFSRKLTKQRPKSDVINYSDSRYHQYPIYSDHNNNMQYQQHQQQQTTITTNNNNNHNNNNNNNHNNNNNKKSYKGRFGGFRRIRSLAPKVGSPKEKIKRNKTADVTSDFYSKPRQDYFQREIQIYDC